MFAPLVILLSEAASEAGRHAGGLAQDKSFWLLLSFLIVVGILWRAGVHKSIGSGLDKRAQEIADELDRARALRDEAQELLAKFQRRQHEAEAEAEGIIEQAKTDAKRIAEEARQRIEEQLERRAKSAEEKIGRAEAQAIAEVRGQTADLAVEAARAIIRERMDQGAQSALAERAIDEVSSKLH